MSRSGGTFTDLKNAQTDANGTPLYGIDKELAEKASRALLRVTSPASLDPRARDPERLPRREGSCEQGFLPTAGLGITALSL